MSLNWYFLVIPLWYRCPMLRRYVFSVFIICIYFFNLSTPHVFEVLQITWFTCTMRIHLKWNNMSTLLFLDLVVRYDDIIFFSADSVSVNNMGNFRIMKRSSLLLVTSRTLVTVVHLGINGQLLSTNYSSPAENRVIYIKGEFVTNYNQSCFQNEQTARGQKWNTRNRTKLL